MDEEASRTSYTDTGRFFNFQAFEGIESSTIASYGDEARYNLATRVMSNGVEVIVAGDKSKSSIDRNNVLRILPSQMYKPMTLAPSTLKNQMILIDPIDLKDNLTFAINPNQFVTKTCLTTYTYRTTYLQDGTTTIESREKVISNIATEERNYMKISPTSTSGVTLSRTPEFVVGVFHTTYTYLNTILDDGLPIILSSKHTLTNTITGPEDYISFLQPSEEVTPVHETNTYFSKITMTKTIQESDNDKLISTSNVLRQVVITESYPSKSTSVMTSYIALDSASNDNSEENDVYIYATKTYLTTFTYFTTVLKSDSQQSGIDTEVNSHIRIVENVITESIPNQLLLQDAISDFQTLLKMTSTKTITTLVTLIGGHTLEVTAMKTPQSQVSSKLAIHHQNKNSSVDTIEHEAQKIDEETFSVDENQDEEIKDELIDSDDLDNVVASSDHSEHIYNIIAEPEKRNKTKHNDKNGFQVSNLIGSFNLNGLNALGPVINAMAGLINTKFVAPTRKDLVSDKLSINNISSKNLLKNISNLDTESFISHDYFGSNKQRTPIYIPVTNTNEAVSNNRLSSPSTLHIAPPKPQLQHQQKFFLQSDEKANRNNKLEILVGKPTYETPLLNGGIPISPGEVITANSDVIIGKPAGIRPHIPFPNKSLTDSINPPVLPLKNHPTSPKLIPLISYHQQQNFPRNPIKPPNKVFKLPPTPSSLHAPNRNVYFQPGQNVQHLHYIPERKPAINNEILEIKRIPEVYSADFPVFEMKKVRNNADKPMLVNIQPSQVASVMIPHGNTPPVLIIESTAELHKNGHYYDEPSPYPNTIIGVDYNHDFDSNRPPLKTGNEPLTNVSETVSVPVQVNLDSSVLSHNIDVHVPPLTFIKENEFPHSTSIRGQHINGHPTGSYDIPSYNLHVPGNLHPQGEYPIDSHFHHTQQYPVEGMEPPPEVSKLRPHSPQNIPVFNKYRPFAQHPYHYHYDTPYVKNVYADNINNYQKFNENTHLVKYDGQPQKDQTPLEYGQSGYDNSPVDHSQAPSITDGITDEHRDDDYENEEGEVIQESNSLPVIPGQYIDYPTSTLRTSPFNMSWNMPSASAINELPHMDESNEKPLSWSIKPPSSIASASNAVASVFKVDMKIPPHYESNKTSHYVHYNQEFVQNFAPNNSQTENKLTPATSQNFASNAADKSQENLEISKNVNKLIDTWDKITSNSNESLTQKTHTSNNQIPLNNKPMFMNDIDKESEEIFDFKESINPHNLQVVNSLEDFTSPSQLEETFSTSVPNSKPNKMSTVPPFSTTEEVVGMSPPPISLRPPNHLSTGNISRKPFHPLQKYTTRVSLPSLNLMARNTSTPSKGANVPVTTWSPPVKVNNSDHITLQNGPIKPWTQEHWLTPTTVVVAPNTSTTRNNTTPHRLSSSNSTVQFSTSSSISSATASANSKRKQQTTPLSTKPTYTDKNGPGQKKVPIPSLNSKLAIIATPSIKVYKHHNMSHATIILHSSSSANPGLIDSEDMINEFQSFPDSILVAGSEPALVTDRQLISTSYLNSKKTLVLEKPMNATTRISSSSRTVVPTKYLTNTKTLTVTTTKTTVIKSRGVPSTQTLILYTTQTSTLVDTVTETQTHTLLQPTKVTLDPMTTTQVYTTVTTVYTMQPIHSPEKEPTPPEDLVNETDESDFLEKVPDLLKNHSNLSSSSNSAGPIILRKGSSGNPTQISTAQNNSGDQHESIFVVMTDQRNIGLINLASDHNMRPINHGEQDKSGHEPSLDSIDLPNRDEDTINGESNHVLLGGVLIASPPKASNNMECRPDCKGSRNEICQSVNGHMRCMCRAGFARMFPDRPCKPTYTFQLSLPLQRLGKDLLIYNDTLSNTESESFFNLASLTHEAVDRMVMQSDFRDIYHGVHVTGLESTSSGKGVLGKLYLQLSDNSDEQRLVDVFRKYLRSTNYSIGGTELHSAQTSSAIGGTDDLKASDFDECLDREFHDCSPSAYCFNLHGTYTCSCKEGYADISENPIYPGRICSTEQIGCDKCHYHGSCYSRDSSYSGNVLCECFPWYAGASCQLNLKILLIALLAFGALLLLLLLFCLLITCSKRRKNRSMQGIMSSINILPTKGSRLMGSSDKLMKQDKRNMIKDSSSEASNSLDTLPYIAKKNYAKEAVKQVTLETSQRHVAVTPMAEIERHCNLLDQNDRSLTVMIPRAKYHPMTMQMGPDCTNAQPFIPAAMAEAKLLSYWDATGSSLPSPKKMSSTTKQQNLIHIPSAGALVSAGYEVSATVDGKANDSQKSSKFVDHKKKNSLPNSGNQSQYSTYKAGLDNVMMDPIDAWSGTMHRTDITASEVRSYDETTIQPQTKSLFSVYDKQLSNLNNDEANTMAERDIGSTFLLPHTHLYKPDRGSDDISGFDSF